MASEQSLHMNRGEGEASYARNSTTQNAGQNRMKPLIQEAVSSLWKSSNTLRNVVIADLGCSSGPNTITLVKTAVEAIFGYCVDQKELLPEIFVLLNDLPGNDFNNVAKTLDAFQQTTQQCSGQIATAIVPGSFYNRLFLSNSVNLILSSNSLNWLSEVPQDLKKSKIPMYDNDEGIKQARRPFVVQACGRQFRKDFKHFLNIRAQELVPMGQMVLCMVGRPSRDTDYQSIQPWDVPFVPLNEMASRGLISREMLDSLYLPLYGPTEKELTEIIEDEGSFEINKIQEHGLRASIEKNLTITPKTRALAARAAFEPTIAQHFGYSDEVMGEFVRIIECQFNKKAQHVSAAPADSLLFLYVSVTKRY